MAIYGGRPLTSRSRCWWQVRTWDVGDAASPWSEPAYFELGLVRPIMPLRREWEAQVIASAVRGDRSEGAPAPYFRKVFTIDGEVESARLYITALGLYEATINGREVTGDTMRPGWTDYRFRLPYQVYDVTSLVQRGQNVIGAVVGDGWYCGHSMHSRGRQNYGERPALLTQLEISLRSPDGAVVVATDGTWRTATGAVLRNDNYKGERYDARLEPSGWQSPDYDASGWEAVEILGLPLAALVGSVAPPVRVTEEIAPVDVWEQEHGVHLVDLGQNIAGRVRLHVTGPAGMRVQMRHGEGLNPDRSLWTDNLFAADATDEYILRGDADGETWTPCFTFHGFRYVELTGLPERPAPEAVTGLVLHSDMERTGHFECSNPAVNRLYENIVWSQRGNSIDVPTDCPQRSERLGWTGDVASFVRTAIFNYDGQAFFEKWATDLLDSQIRHGQEEGQFPVVAPAAFPSWGGGPAWSDAAIVVPWTLYLVYGDTRLADRMFPALERWMTFLDRQAAGLAPDAWTGFGDWVSLDFDPDHKLGLDDRWGGTPLELLRLAFHARAADLMARLAEATGRDCWIWRRCFEELREQFAREQLEAGRLKTPTQTACALTLQFDLLSDPASRRAVAEDLARDVERRGHLVTGFVGTPYLLLALETAGRVDLAYRLLERTELPGWLFEVEHGATTIWERWDAWTPERGYMPPGSMNSLNHYAYGAVGHWLHRTVGGLDFDDLMPGGRKLLIAPRPGGSITWARAELETRVGRAACAWQRDADKMQIEITIPPGAEASVRLPVSNPEQVSGPGLTGLRQEDGAVWGEVVA